MKENQTVWALTIDWAAEVVERYYETFLYSNKEKAQEAFRKVIKDEAACNEDFASALNATGYLEACIEGKEFLAIGHVIDDYAVSVQENTFEFYRDGYYVDDHFCLYIDEKPIL